MKRKIFVLPALIAGMTLVACGGGNKPGPEPTGDYNLTFNSNTLTISSTALQKGKDFEATVKMNIGLISKYDMPVTLGNIQVQGGEDIKYTDYTYEINGDKESAKIVIPGQYITNNLTITADAKLVQHELIFSKSSAFKIDKPIVGKNESLNTDIYVKEDWKGYVTLPSTLEISIGGEALSKFDYRVIEDGVKVHLKIDAAYITDDIIVTSVVTPDDYTVKLANPDSCKLSLDKDSVTVATAFDANISLTEQGEIYTLPESLTITCVDNQTMETYTIPKTRGYYYSSTSGHLTIYKEWVFGNITIDAEAEQASDILTVESSSDETELLFYKDPEFKNQITGPIKIVITEPETYSIYVRTKNSADPNYIVPSTFDITNSDGESIPYDVDYGGISHIIGDKHYATITIEKEKAKGRVHVYGVAQGNEKHMLKVKAVGLQTSDLPEYIDDPQAIECTFTPTESYDLPLAENVNICIDEVWYDGNGYYSDTEKKDGISYNAETGKLTVTKEVVENITKEGSDIVIIAKPKSLSVLKYLTSNDKWGELHALSMYGYKLFTPGETTGDFYLDGYDYPFQARLIGFAQERGSTDTGYVQGLTLEFTTAISSVQYYQDKTSNNIYYKKDFAGIFESNLYKLLNNAGGIIDKLPAKIKSNLYQVTKHGLSTDGLSTLNSLNYLYPLSLSEMNEGLINPSLDTKYLNESANKNDPVYHYYRQFTTIDELKAARIKGYQSSTASAYWLRTPDLEATNKDFNIMNTGATTTNTQTTKGLVPAFCI